MADIQLTITTSASDALRLLEGGFEAVVCWGRDSNLVICKDVEVANRCYQTLRNLGFNVKLRQEAGGHFVEVGLPTLNQITNALLK